jgi:sodium/potassium-transporting ATPase subunit alpha
MPFNSHNKFALTIIEYPKSDSDYCVLIKGAPEKIWGRCRYILKDGGAIPLDDSYQKKFAAVNLAFGKNGERVLGFAKLHLPRTDIRKPYDFDTSNPDNFNFPFRDLTFVGLISLQDPPKDSVPWAVKRCRSAGIKVIMVTGDQPPTAGAIAKQVNIIPRDVQTNVDLMEDDPDLDWWRATEVARAIVVHGDYIQQSFEKEILNGATDET